VFLDRIWESFGKSWERVAGDSSLTEISALVTVHLVFFNYLVAVACDVYAKSDRNSVEIKVKNELIL